MTPIPNQHVITANGEYSFESHATGDEVVIEWDITAGTATVEPGVEGLVPGLHRPGRDLAGEKPVFGTEGGSLRIELGNSGKATLKVTAAAGLSMIVCQTLVKR